MTPDTLLLRPLPGKLEWCCPNEAQPPVIVEQAAYLQPNALADLPDAGNACLFLSPDYFCFRRVELPTENYKTSEQTLGWLVEDAVVGAVQDCVASSHTGETGGCREGSLPDIEV